MNDDLIKDQITEWTDDKVMFSAYDITIALRNSGERISHDHVKGVVHNLFTNSEMDSGYSRAMITIPGTSDKAFVYHHITSDLDEYEPVKATYSTSNDPSQAVVSNTLAPTIVQRIGDRNKQPVNDVLDKAYPAHDGRLNIPMTFIKKAGLFNKKFSIIKENNRVVVTKETSDGTVVKPTASSAIIVSRTYIKHLNKGVYKIRLENKEIIIE